MKSLKDQEALDAIGQQWLECVAAIRKRSAEVGSEWSQDRAGALLAILAQAGYTFVKFDDLSDDGITPKSCLATIRELQDDNARLKAALKSFAHIADRYYEKAAGDFISPTFSVGTFRDAQAALSPSVEKL